MSSKHVKPLETGMSYLFRLLSLQEKEGNNMNATAEYLEYVREMVDEYSVDMIYCPMCEVIHENNSNCQRND